MCQSKTLLPCYNNEQKILNKTCMFSNTPHSLEITCHFLFAATDGHQILEEWIASVCLKSMWK